MWPRNAATVRFSKQQGPRTGPGQIKANQSQSNLHRSPITLSPLPPPPITTDGGDL
jgi:hypothetical protein